MRTTNSRFQPTDAVLDIPLPLAETLYPSDLTASQLRAAIVMLSRVNADGRFEILKTQLEAAAELRIDNGTRFLAPIIDSLIGGLSGDPEPWFDDVEYKPGIRRQTAGIITGTLSSYGHYHMRLDRGFVPIRVDEFRSYSSVHAILLRLRVGAWFHRQAGVKQIKIRMQSEDVYAIFGDYCRTARRQRPDGDFEITLGRLLQAVLVPAAEQINAVCNDYSVGLSARRKAVGAVGRALQHVDIVVNRLEDRATLKDLVKASRYRDRVQKLKRV
jgi:hypothetical protein|tara:strand:+ start:9316 stop:10131 length:816 start_codon:yes stop_codon:yes gene_type:complete